MSEQEHAGIDQPIGLRLESVSMRPYPLGGHRLAGRVEYAWMQGRPEPADFARAREACLASEEVDATDPVLGALRITISEFEVRYRAEYREWRGTIVIEGRRP